MTHIHRPRITRALGVLVAAGLAACGPAEESSMSADDTLDFARLPIASPRLADEHHYTARDGTRLPLRSYGSGAPIDLILVHGSGAWNAYLAELAATIADSGVAVVHTPDLRGHGVAPARRGDLDYEDQLEDDLADWIAVLRAADPERLVVVGGHSSGGGLAVRMAGGAHADAIDGFLLLAPYLGHDAPTTREDSGGWARPRTGRIVAISILNGFGVHAFDDATVIDFEMPVEVRTGAETLHYTFRMMKGLNPRPFPSDLEALRAPTLVVVGSEDEAFFADAFAETFAEYAPRARVVEIPGASHLGLAADPETALVSIAWLAELAAVRDLASDP